MAKIKINKQNKAKKIISNLYLISIKFRQIKKKQKKDINKNIHIYLNCQKKDHNINNFSKLFKIKNILQSW